MLFRTYVTDERFRDGELPKDNSSSAGCRRRQEQRAPSLYRGRSTAHHGLYLARLLEYREFFQSGPATGCSHVVSVQPGPATPSSASFVPPVSSLCLDTKRGIDPMVIGSSGCLTLQLLQMNQTWKGELTELPVKKSC